MQIVDNLMSLLFLVTSLSPQQDFIRLVNAEKTKYSLLTYSQHYLDEKNNPVEYTGTLYLQMASSTLESCTLSIEVLVQDRFTGMEEKRTHFSKTKSLLEQRSFTYRYSYKTNLKDEKLEADLVEARPAQLLQSTGFTCQENTGCKLLWLRLKAPKPAIKETKEINGLRYFNQSVAEIEIPMSARDAALQMAQSLDHLAEVCR